MLLSLLVFFRHIFPAEAVAVAGYDCCGCGFLARRESGCSQPWKAPEKSGAEGRGHSLLVRARIRLTLQGKPSLPHVSTFIHFRQILWERRSGTHRSISNHYFQKGQKKILEKKTRKRKVLTFLVFLDYDLVTEGASSCP